MTDGNGRSALDRAGQTKKQGAAFRKESGALPCAGQKENPQPKLRVCGGPFPSAFEPKTSRRGTVLAFSLKLKFSTTRSSKT